jgi:predicted lysophospholipase L1 biosynthesis ABC-type transport system permease subunit
VDAAGIVIGLVGAAAFGRLLDSLVFRTDPADPLILAAAAATLAVVAAFAAALPALRAAHVEPRTVLAEE